MKNGASIIAADRAAAAALQPDELTRYSRHLLMPEVTVAGQERLKAARVLCLGAGGLGSPAALYLAAAGIGTLGIVDDDAVDLSNLQRQILHGTADIGRPKIDSARARLAAINPHVRIVTHAARLAAANALELIGDYDVVIDGSDNFPTRYVVNDTCVLLRKPLVYGAIFRFDGQISLFAPHLGAPCYRCLFPQPPPAGSVPNCAEAGVLGVLPGIVGTMQALEAIKLIVGIGHSLGGRLLHFDALEMSFRDFHVRRDPECPVCGDTPTIRAPVDLELSCTTDNDDHALGEISALDLKARLDRGENIFLLDVREPYERAIAQIDGSALIPLGELLRRVDEIPRDRPVAVYCKVGLRSAQGVLLLHTAGITNALNLAGGIDAWADEVEPEMPRY